MLGKPSARNQRTRWQWLWPCLALLVGLPSCGGQGTLPHSAMPDLTLPPSAWATAASAAEQQVVEYDRNTPLEYKFHRKDEKGEMRRLVLECSEGSVARLTEHNGQMLTADEDKDERRRLQDILDHPDAYLRHVRREDGSRTYAVELLRSMAKAMLWSYVPGQPQVSGSPGPSVVLDFTPDPQFKPPSLVTEALTGIAGRVWVDAKTHNVVRIQGHILHPINFGWAGVLARIKEGGTVELDQRPVANGRWIFTHLVEHLTIREVLVHTAEENVEIITSDFKPLPAPLTAKEAVERLMAMPLATR